MTALPSWDFLPGSPVWESRPSSPVAAPPSSPSEVGSAVSSEDDMPSWLQRGAPTPPLFRTWTIPEVAWECCTCAEDFLTEPWSTKDDDPVCDNCIRKQFTQAMKYDIEWPAKWAGVELDIRDFEKLWADDEQFISDYLKQVDAHKVVRLEDDGLNLEDDRELVRGKDYQRCPKCKVAVSLRDGCNHMSCPKCAQQFCYICGQQARGGSKHWTAGGCPRYGRPDEGNAIYDGDDGEVAVLEVHEDDEEPRERSLPELVALGRVALVPWEEQNQQVDSEALGVQERHHQGFAMESWAWNVTMQTTDAQTRGIMQRILEVPVEDGEHHEPPSPGEQARVMGAMLRYRPEHGVREAEWRRLRVAGTNDVMSFVDSDELQGETTDHFPVRHGVLSHRVGGVFNLLSRNSMWAARDWAVERQRAWAQNPDRHDDLHPDNFAIFALGPGQNAPQRALAQILFDLMLWHGRQLTLGRMTFTRIETSNSSALLARLSGPYIPELRSHLSFSDAIPAVEREMNPLHGLAVFLRFDPEWELGNQIAHLPEEALRAEITARLWPRVEEAVHEDVEMVHTQFMVEEWEQLNPPRHADALPEPARRVDLTTDLFGNPLQRD